MIRIDRSLLRSREKRVRVLDNGIILKRRTPYRGIFNLSHALWYRLLRALSAYVSRFVLRLVALVTWINIFSVY